MLAASMRLIGVASVLAHFACSADGGLCQDVACTDAPPSSCEGGKVLVEHRGTCNPATGACAYEEVRRICVLGCAGGACTGGSSAWGWVAVIEREAEDAYGDAIVQGVQAHFAANLHYERSLPHHASMFLAEEAQDGPCTFYGPLEAISMCVPGCNGNEECVRVAMADDGETYACRPLPGIFDAGTLTVTGMKTPIALAPDASRRYIATGTPEDLFDQGATIQATTSGGELGPLTLSATGVAPLQVPSTVVSLRAGQPTTIAWTAGDPGSRIKLVLRRGHHYPSPPGSALVCDVEDGDGQVQISANLVDRFLVGGWHPFGWITRYTTQVLSPWGKPVELFVGHVVGLQLLLEE